MNCTRTTTFWGEKVKLPDVSNYSWRGKARDRSSEAGCAGVRSLETELRNTYEFDSIIGHHEQLVRILKLVSQVADTDATVLIYGESGTGKELIAQSLHDNSQRSNNPFVPINCGALPENILESELFGHVRGAFTGAVRDHAGWLERANGGTIFLDEVSEMAATLQVKLLRILQTGDYSPVGSTRNRKCDIRFVAATNQNLQEMIQQARFREDLYYRLNVIDIDLPPLRERKSDISLLVQHFMNLYTIKYNKEDVGISKDAQGLLLAYNFPGNVRELENIIQRCVALAENHVIKPNHLPSSLNGEGNHMHFVETHSCFKTAKQHIVEEFEKEYICDCLKVSKGHISHAAKSAGLDVKNFYEKMKKYGIDAHSYKIPA